MPPMDMIFLGMVIGSFTLFAAALAYGSAVAGGDK